MCRRATIRLVILTGILLAVVTLWGQNRAWTGGTSGTRPSTWLPSVATGPVNRVWYSTDGSVLFARTLPAASFRPQISSNGSQVGDPRIVPPSSRTPRRHVARGRPQAGPAWIHGRIYGRAGCLPVGRWRGFVGQSHGLQRSLDPGREA